MVVNLWLFLSIIVPCSLLFAGFAAYIGHQSKMKELEIEAIKAEKANLQIMVDDTVEAKLKNQQERIQILEAIVTDKKYDLSEKITRLKS